jgi:hypothetical protein
MRYCKHHRQAVALLGLAMAALALAPFAHAENCASYGDQSWNGNNPYVQLPDADPHQMLNLDVWSVGSNWNGGWVNLCSHAGPDGSWTFRGEWQVNGSIVQAYPHATRGWDWFHWLPHPTPGGDGFPVRSGDAGLYSKVQYDPGPLYGTFDVSYDIWLSDRPNPGPGDPLTEIMVWLNRGGGLEPLQNNGGYLGTTTLGNVAGTWSVYAGSMDSSYQGVGMQWPVYSYVSTQPLGSFDGDLQPFVWNAIHDFQNRVPRSNHMNDDWYVLGVQFGAEPVAGYGRLDAWYYDVRPGW